MGKNAAINAEVRKFIEGMPKTSLHMHLEGSLEPGLAFEIATRNGIDPGSPGFPYATVDALRKAYSFSDLKSFLDLYYSVSRVLRERRDFRDLAAAFCDKAISQNIRRAEVFFDPQAHTGRGIPFREVADGINEGLDEGRKRGLSVGLIASILRDSPVGTPRDKAGIDAGFGGAASATGWATVMQVAEYNASAASPAADRPGSGRGIIGIGLDSNEDGFPPELFTGIYAFARENGLLCTAHAGEEGPPEYIWEAVKNLKCVRIDHGVRCVEDAGLVAFLSAPRDSEGILRAYHRPHRIPATVCPLSNHKLKVFPDPSRTNILELLDGGILACVNSDDPAYFGGYANENYLALLEWLGPGNPHSRPINLADIHRLCLNGFESSWLPLGEKSRLIAEAEDYFLREPVAL